MTVIIAILGGFIVGALAIYLAYRPVISRQDTEVERIRGEMFDTLQRQRCEAAEVSARLEREREELSSKLDGERELRGVVETEKARLEERLGKQDEGFKNMAADIMTKKSKELKEVNMESLESVLKPFKDKIEDFRKRVDEIYVQEAQQRFSLKEEIKNLNEMNLRISSDANNLTAALKGNSKIQGDWGEMILDSILDGSNLKKGIHYRIQESVRSEEGANMRPDVILNLPEGKEIVIDSKVSLTAFVNYCESENHEDRRKHIREHIRSFRNHINELGSKNYQQTIVNSPDFVIMFVPNEPAFMAALQNDNTLWSDAYNKKVVISSPTNFFALIKIVDDLWKRDNQSKNAIAIAEQGSKLYEKLAGFTKTMTDLGKNLSRANVVYDDAVKQLMTGRGNAISQAEKLRELGIKVTKNISDQFADFDEHEEFTEVVTVAELPQQEGDE